MSKKLKEFRVSLEGMQLTGQAEKRMERAIQAAVLNELVSYKPNPEDGDKPFPSGGLGPIVVVPKPWPGLRLRLLDKVQIAKLGIQVG